MLFKFIVWCLLLFLYFFYHLMDLVFVLIKIFSYILCYVCVYIIFFYIYTYVLMLTVFIFICFPYIILSLRLINHYVKASMLYIICFTIFCISLSMYLIAFPYFIMMVTKQLTDKCALKMPNINYTIILYYGINFILWIYVQYLCFFIEILYGMVDLQLDVDVSGVIVCENLIHLNRIINDIIYIYHII